MSCRPVGLKGLEVNELFVIGNRLPVFELSSLPSLRPDNEHYAAHCRGP
jgi:hypothetical protein